METRHADISTRLVFIMQKVFFAIRLIRTIFLLNPNFNFTEVRLYNLEFKVQKIHLEEFHYSLCFGCDTFEV